MSSDDEDRSDSGAEGNFGAGDERTTLVVLYGGQSAEHQVSCVSALHVARAVDPSRYDVRLVGITTGGKWVDATAVFRALEAGTASLPSPDVIGIASVGSGGEGGAGEGGAGEGGPGEDERTAGAPERRLRAAGEAGAVAALVRAAERASNPDREVVVLPLLHGPKGEDGTVQGLLEVAGLAYVGAGVVGSAAAMDKGVAKGLLAAAGLPQAHYICLRESELDESVARRVEDELGWPVFVKPANLGSSIGITRAGGPVELAGAIELARRYDEWLVIEEAVFGREVEVGVICSDPVRVSVPGEIIPGHAFYDYADKYLEDGAVLEVPARLPAHAGTELTRLAAAACRALRVDGMARVDFFFEDPGRGWLVNEVNTIPGFTPISMYPRLWAASGLSYAALLDELVDLGRRRHRRRQAFDTRRP